MSLSFATRKIRPAAALVSLMALTACGQITGTAAPRLNATGEAVRGTYSVTTKNIAEVRARGLETVNNSRTAAGLGPLAASGSLTLAADQHSTSMSEQKRAWAFGANGETPISRISQAGYSGSLIGQLVSETYESEVRTIATWLGDPEQKAILFDPAATHMGLGVHQDPNDKLWWTLIVAK